MHLAIFTLIQLNSSASDVTYMTNNPLCVGFNLINLYLRKAGGEMDGAKLKVIIVEEIIRG